MDGDAWILGDRYWEVRADRVSVDDPRPAPAELADLLDASWLLGCELSGGEEITADGRAAYRVSVRGRATLGQHRPSELLEPAMPAVAVVDAETGRLLRLTCFAGEAGDQPACRYELRDAADAADDDGDGFTFEVPDGLRVARVGADDDRPTTQLRVAKDSVRRARRGRCRPGMRHRPWAPPSRKTPLSEGLYSPIRTLS
jgi:hypothetical protein